MKGSKNTRNNVLDVACTRNRNVGLLSRRVNNLFAR